MTIRRDRERDEVINSVIDILIPLNTEKQTPNDALRDAVNREAAEVTVLRMGGNVKTVPANFLTVAKIVAKIGSPTISDFAVARCLKIYEAHKEEFFTLASNDALDAATKMLDNSSYEIRERTITAVAESGWYGRIEGLARKYLSRGLTAEEVMALVNKYVGQKGSRCNQQEDDLIRMARTYAPEKVGKVRYLIGKFVEEFDRNDI